MKPMHTKFYVGSLVSELHLICEDNFSWAFHYFKSFTKFLQDCTFEKHK